MLQLLVVIEQNNYSCPPLSQEENHSTPICMQLTYCTYFLVISNLSITFVPAGRECRREGLLLEVNNQNPYGMWFSESWNFFGISAYSYTLFPQKYRLGEKDSVKWCHRPRASLLIKFLITKNILVRSRRLTHLCLISFNWSQCNIAFNNIFQAFVKRNWEPGEFGLSFNNKGA